MQIISFPNPPTAHPRRRPIAQHVCWALARTKGRSCCETGVNSGVLQWRPPGGGGGPENRRACGGEEAAYLRARPRCASPRALNWTASLSKRKADAVDASATVGESMRGVAWGKGPGICCGGSLHSRGCAAAGRRRAPGLSASALGERRGSVRDSVRRAPTQAWEPRSGRGDAGQRNAGPGTGPDGTPDGPGAGPAGSSCAGCAGRSQQRLLQCL